MRSAWRFLFHFVAVGAMCVLPALQGTADSGQGKRGAGPEDTENAVLALNAEPASLSPEPADDSLALKTDVDPEEAPRIDLSEAEALLLIPPAALSNEEQQRKDLQLTASDDVQSLEPPDGEEPVEGDLDLQKIKLDWLYRLIEEKMPKREVRMGLNDCVRTALERNQDILIVSYEPLKADGDVLTAQGEFDPILQTTVNYTRYETDPRESPSNSLNSSNFQGLDLRDSGLGVGDIGSGLFGTNTSTQGQSITQQILSQLGNEIWLDLVGPGPTAESIATYYKQYQAQLGGKLKWGTQYGVQFQLRDQNSNVDLTDGWYNDTLISIARLVMWLQNQDTGAWNDMLSYDEFSGGLTLTLSQPLLKGRGKVNLTRIQIAHNARSMTDAQAEQQVMTIVAQVMKGYWDYVGAVENVRVRREALANAERLLDITSRRHEIGTGAAIEVLQAKAGVATCQGDLITAFSQVDNAGDVLKQLLDMRDEDLISPVRIIPLDRPELREIQVDEKASTARALENRPEIQMAQLDIDSARLDRRRAANEMLPQVDIQGSAFTGGRGNHAGDVFDGIKDRNENSYTIGISGQVPLGNRMARGAYHRAAVTARQAEQRLAKAEQELALNVSVACRGVETSRVLLESSRQARALQETNVEAEEKRLQFGVTTSYNVLQQQQDLTAAQVQELQSLVGFEKAMVDLQLAEGTVLNDAGVVFEPPEPEPTVRFTRSIIPPEPETE